MSDNKANRIKELRKTLDLSQKDFALRLGVTDVAISRIERGERSLTEQMAKSICREYKVNYPWLINGTGEIFSNLPETLIDEIAEEYELDELDKQLVQGYLKLSKEQRKMFRSFINMNFLNEKDE